MFLFYTKQGGLYESRHSRAGGTAGRRVPADAGIQRANESDKQQGKRHKDTVVAAFSCV